MTSPERAPRLLTLMALSALSPLAINIIAPSLPGLARAFQTDYAVAQAALSLYLLVFALSQLVVGPLSDAIGRRPVVLGGLVVFGLGQIAAAAAPTIEWLLAARVVQAMGGAAGLAIARAIVRDVHGGPAAAAMIGYMTTGLAVAQMVGPALGGVLDEAFGWRAIFLMLAAATVVVTIACLADLGETNRAPSRRFDPASLARAYGTLVRTPAFVWNMSTAAAASAVYFAFMGAAPFVAREMIGLTPIQYGLWFVGVSAGYAIGNFISGRLTERVGMARMVTTGNVVQVIAVAVQAAFFAAGHVTAATLFVPLFVAAVANGMTLPSANAGAIGARPELAGAAAGLAGCVQIGTGAAATALVGHLLTTSAMPLAWVSLAAAVAATLLGRRAARHL